MFANMTTDNLAKNEDKLGGNFEPLASGIYPATITLAYLGKSQRSDARSVTLHYDVDGTEYRETIWFTNGKGENFYVDKNDGKTKVALPGFTVLNDITLFVTEKPLSDNDDGIATKTVKLYNFEERKELPTEVECLTFLHGGKVNLGVLRQIEDKNKRDEASGEYKPTGETVTKNIIDKVFHAETRRTIPEYMHGVESDEFARAWENKNAGKDRNRAVGVNMGGGQSGTGSPNAGGAQTATKSLFS